MDARDSVDAPPFRANSKIGVGVSQVVMDSRSSVGKASRNDSNSQKNLASVEVPLPSLKTLNLA